MRYAIHTPKCTPRTQLTGHYVYIYTDPLDKRIFYIGKGKNNRAYSHLRGKGHNDNLNSRLAWLRAQGWRPGVVIIPTSTRAYALELERGLIKLTRRLGHDLFNVQGNVMKL